jgi:hypothetical protein
LTNGTPAGKSFPASSLSQAFTELGHNIHLLLIVKKNYKNIMLTKPARQAGSTGLAGNTQRVVADEISGTTVVFSR